MKINLTDIPWFCKVSTDVSWFESACLYFIFVSFRASTCKMSSSTDKFTHVAFINIQEAYCHRNNLECQFTISPLLTVTCSDFIGVFKVGWKSTRDFVSKKTVFIPANFTPETALETAVLFDGLCGLLC